MLAGRVSPGFDRGCELLEVRKRAACLICKRGGSGHDNVEVVLTRAVVEFAKGEGDVTADQVAGIAEAVFDRLRFARLEAGDGTVLPFPPRDAGDTAKVHDVLCVIAECVAQQQIAALDDCATAHFDVGQLNSDPQGNFHP